MGDIGKPGRRIELEPEPVPEEAPVIEPAVEPAEPEPVEIPAGSGLYWSLDGITWHYLGRAA